VLDLVKYLPRLPCESGLPLGDSLGKNFFPFYWGLLDKVFPADNAGICKALKYLQQQQTLDRNKAINT